MATRAHVEWLREGVVRWNRRRKKVHFLPDLSGIKFFDLLPKDYRDDPKTSRTFEQIDLSGANLKGSDLSHLNFRKANFDRANLQSANLSLSNFEDARFHDSNLLEVDGQNSNFGGAVFVRSKTQEMRFEGADLSGTLFIETVIPDKQRKELASNGAEFFQTQRAYRSSVRDAGPVIGNYIKTGHLEKRAKDTKTRKNKYDVYFGTNRQPIIERGALVGFDSSQDNQIHYGLCEVIVPDGHKIGSLGSPLWKRLRNKSDDRLRIDSLISLNEELLFSHLRATAQKMSLKMRPTVFVHGFNNSFEDAIVRAAQIGYDLGIGQGIGLYSWPSKAKKRKYSADEASAEASKYLLADFLEKFVLEASERSVNVIAHSMGCRCLLGALEVLAKDRKAILKRIYQVILAAADVDTAIMPNLGVNATQYCRRTTSYVSDQDKALKVSGWLHSFPRVGFTPPTYILSGMDTVLVNNDDLGILSHGYVGNSRSVLADIFALLKANEAPSQRYSIEAVGTSHWRIKD